MTSFNIHRSTLISTGRREISYSDASPAGGVLIYRDFRGWLAHRSRLPSTARHRKKYSYRPLLHQHGWTIRFHPATGDVTATRPGGRPYEIRRSPPYTSAWQYPDSNPDHDVGPYSAA
jgi:hypothetical protein